MLNTIDFAACIRQNLQDRRFGKERADKIIADFEARAQYYRTSGVDPTRANLNAMRDVFENVTLKTTETAKRNAKLMSVQAANNDRIKQGLTVTNSLFVMDGKKGGKGVAVARAAISTVEDDPRFAGLSYSTVKETVRGQLFAIFSDVLEKVGKGAFGVQKGKAHLPNIIKEVQGQATGDRAAKEFADAWLKVSDLIVDLFNDAGGSMTKLSRYVPQSMNAVKMVRAGENAWIDAHINSLDWNRTRWPDGTIIPPEERRRVLKAVYETMTTDGANKVDPTAFRGQGRALGNQLDNHRFLHYKSADDWLAIHEQFGDGNVFDVFVRHIEAMSHRIALVEQFGPNPEAAKQNMHALVRKYSSGLSAKDQADALAVMKNRFDPMFDTIMRDNPMDPHSTMGALVTGTSNILTSAQLGAASLLAIPGDFMQTASVRALNHMGLFDGMHFYLKSIATDGKFMRQIANQTGFVADEVVMSTYATQRFTGLATVGPAITRRIADTVMRLSLMSGHTRSARWAVQAEFMGLMQRSRKDSFEKLPYRMVMERYGITKEDWDAFRTNVQPWTPRKDAKFLRPIDILQSDISNRQELYRKFQGMVFEESRKMVPEATIEGSVALKNTTRPDTLVGAILYSFAMYKNFPVSFNMIYGRLGLSSPNASTRLKFYAGLGASMLLVGALGTQMREVSKGREPLPMNTPSFWGKAALSGGGMSIWGDFLFNGVNQFGRGPQDIAAGPLVAFAGDTSQLVFGDLFQFANSVGTLDEDFKSTTAAKAVEYARRYTPGSSIWWARLALEREVFDRLQEVADPKAYSKRRKREAKRVRDYGNDSWFAPNEKFLGE